MKRPERRPKRRFKSWREGSSEGWSDDGEENATSHKFTRNALHIDVETATLDSKGATVAYTPANPELDKKKLIVKGEDHPKVQMTPIHESPSLEAVTIRTFAAWRCDEERPKDELGLWTPLSALGRIRCHQRDARVPVTCRRNLLHRGDF
ncbi:hypothetical protein FA13DRAFT_1735863 [Coprinellus micaceus]|uniref:Uncharacterized protein n=1 Tax=Coprinellus micaceus TaxID=71717 RepID=A0A4Y7T265_COPMI|nr:hypothetical protein FA13DRAFT_1735863 [Coprinellus micaceus]